MAERATDGPVPDLRVELRFVDSKRFPARVLLGTIEAVDRAIESAEKEELDALEKAFPELPSALFDAMRYRSSNLVAQALNFDSASSGSFILAGAAAALAYWLADKTLGETVKEAWAQSDLHARMKRFLSSRRKEKTEKIAREIVPSRWPNARQDIKVQVEDRSMSVTIVVTVRVPASLEPIPAASEVGRIIGSAEG